MGEDLLFEGLFLGWVDPAVVLLGKVAGEHGVALEENIDDVLGGELDGALFEGFGVQGHSLLGIGVLPIVDHPALQVVLDGGIQLLLLDPFLI